MDRRVALVAAAVFVAAAGAATVVQADFAAATGFSGRYGFTCVSCHIEPPDAVPPATLDVTGIPTEWSPGSAYEVTITVDAGPPPMPAPAPQGGFEIDTDVGRFTIPDSMDGLLRQNAPNMMTYTPEGTLRRTWQVTWHAPTAQESTGIPGTATFWIAAVAANGNHNAELNVSALGETGDRVRALVVQSLPAQDALDAWYALPLLAPVPAVAHVTADDGEQVAIDGRHGDANATHLEWRIDGGAWQSRATQQEWRLVLTDLEPGEHQLSIRSAGAGRVSTDADVTVVVEGGLFDAIGGDRGIPSMTPLVAGALLLAAAVRRK